MIEVENSRKKRKNRREGEEKAKGLSSLSGGGQVDGLPPAASTDQSLEDAPGETELFRNFRKFF